MNFFSHRMRQSSGFAAGMAALWLSACVAGAPALTTFPELSSAEGATYAGVLHLDEYVDDPTTADADLVWQISPSELLDTRLTTERHLIVRTRDKDWNGVETLVVSVSNALGECATGTVTFRVEAVPDDPIIDWIPAQVIGEAAEFRPLDLGYFGSDPDGDAVSWSATAGTALECSVRDDVLTVLRRDLAWRGTEEIVLRLADSTGREASRAVAYTVTDGVPVTLTFIPNQVLLVECGDTRILVDGLVRDLVLLSQREKRRIAAAQPPFDGIDLALATHEHYDHVTPEYVVEHLAASPLTMFGCVSDTIPWLEAVPGYEAIADRVVDVPFVEGRSVELELGGVKVAAYPVRHSGDGSNLAWLMEVGGVRVLVLGDAGFEHTANLRADYGWPDLHIDVAVLPGRWVEVYEGTIVTQDIAPRYVIPGGGLLICPPHLSVPAGAVLPVVVCNLEETWIVPPKER